MSSETIDFPLKNGKWKFGAVALAFLPEIHGNLCMFESITFSVLTCRADDSFFPHLFCAQKWRWFLDSHLHTHTR